METGGDQVKVSRRIVSALLVCACGTLCAVGGELKVGFGRVDITPPLGIKLAGYFRERVSDGVLDPLEANAVAFSDGERTAVLVSIDNISLRAYFTLFRKRVADATGLPQEAVFLATTHIHTGPLLIRRAGKSHGEDAEDFADANEHCKDLCDKVVAVAKAAIGDLAPATLSIARSRAPGISFVRRYRMKDGSVRTAPKIDDPNIESPVGEPDSAVQVVRIDRAGRDTVAVVNFQCHPDTIGGTKISADWPGVVRRTLERSLDGVKCVFVNGAQGDTNQHMCKDQGFARPAERILMHQYMGHRIAGAVLGVWDVCKPIGSGDVRFLIQRVRIPSNRPKPEEMPEARRIVKLYSENPRSKEIPGKSMERNANIADARRKVRLENGPDFFEAPISILCVGKDLAFVGFPGEPFTEYGRAVKAKSPFGMTVPMCLTNGHFGYLPTDEALGDTTSYESRGSIFRSGLEALMVGESVKALNDLVKQQSNMTKE